MDQTPISSKSFRYIEYSPPSPLAQKRRRLDLAASRTIPTDLETGSGSSSVTFIMSDFETGRGMVSHNLPDIHQTMLPHGDSVDRAMSAGVSNINLTNSSHLVTSATLQTSPATNRSLAVVDEEAHAIRQSYMDRDRKGKQTGKMYDRLVGKYVKWWDEDQARRGKFDPQWRVIPAMPITASKVVLFLQFEMQREKYSNGSATETVAGSSVGQSQIAAVISALESVRFDTQHKYKACAEAQVTLRSDNRIRTLERSSKANEPKRTAKSQSLKAKGTSSDTYALEELRSCAMWCLTEFTAPRQMFTGIRDRAMLLLGATTAFRGESSRMLQWSDLFLSDLSIDDLDLDNKIPVLAALADNAKHNQNGRVDEHGCIRHRIVDLCPVAALGLLFFVQFHILHLPLPDFRPDFTKEGYGEYGYRPWYDCYVFWASSNTKQMSYDNHRDRFKVMHEANGVDITKVTHATRSYAAQTARNHGATVSGTKALGGWQESGSFRACYERTLPADALLGTAMFSGRRFETYSLPRGTLEPPPELIGYLFPWIEREEMAYEEHLKSLGVRVTDIALKQFLLVLRFLRCVILQDCAVLFSAHPGLALFKYAPFNLPAFHQFARTAPAQIEQAEQEARAALRHLPQNLVTSMQGILVDLKMHQREVEQRQREAEQRHEEHLTEIREALREQNTKGKGKSKQRSATPTVPLPLSRPAPTPSESLRVRATSVAMSPPPALSLLEATLPTVPSLSVPSPTFRSYPGTGTTIHISGASHTFHISSTSPVPNSRSMSPTSSNLAPSQNRGTTSPLFQVPAPLTVTTRVSSPIAAHSHPTDRELQQAKWGELTAKYHPERLVKHDWEWRDGKWLPYYQYQPVKTIADVWEEWTIGLGGYLSVRELNEGWGPSWRRNNNAAKTEKGRRMKIVALVEQLAGKHRWDVHLALRFLKDRYGDMSPRKFSDFLSSRKGAGLREVLNAADSYTGGGAARSHNSTNSHTTNSHT